MTDAPIIKDRIADLEDRLAASEAARVKLERLLRDPFETGPAAEPGDAERNDAFNRGHQHGVRAGWKASEAARERLREALAAVRDIEILHCASDWRSRHSAQIIGAALAADAGNEQGANERKHPCRECGLMRSEREGGTVFSVCDDCWDKRDTTQKGTQ